MQSTGDGTRGLLGKIRAASAWLRARLLVALLAGAYAMVLPVFVLMRRWRRPRPSGWRVRDDPDLASLRRLREPY